MEEVSEKIQLSEHEENENEDISENNTSDEITENSEPADSAEELSEKTADEQDIAYSASDENVSEKTDLKSNDITDFTASMWKYFPIPDNEPEKFPEYLVKSENYEKSSIIGARVRGKKHKHEGTNCDDWFETALSGDIIYIAVADGAGSKKYSRIGAKEACRTVCGYLKYTFETEIINKNILNNLSSDLSDKNCISVCRTLAGIVQHSIKKAYSAVESAFYSRVPNSIYSDLLGRTINIRDFSSTLLVAVVVPIENEPDKKLTISCQIGDGMIALINTNESFEKSVKLMGEPDSGEFSGETDFLTSKNLIESDKLAVRTRLSIDSSDIMMIMTDGVADDYFPNESQMNRLYLDLLANGILSSDECLLSSKLTPNQFEIIKKLPESTIYPWVNDNTVEIGLNYTKNICSKLNISLENLWNERSVLSSAKLQVKGISNDADTGERLKIWLDNYVERGSFDDRTLVIVKM
ncbi:MAG: protein phosphatase 2C domain-containing protein [Ruminococcus sp.]|nr:protein phosphatase 2C domain-containing protein [Ruminococcus sp.]